MKKYNRIIFSDNGVLADWSSALGDYFASSKTMALVALEDMLYIGSYLPFNNRYIDVSTANDQAAVLSVDIWDGNSWNAAVDVIDETSVGGISLAQSGMIHFSIDRNETWGLESSTEDITALEDAKIYDMYWARLKWSADLKATTALSYVGWRFSNDSGLQQFYPDMLNTNLLTSFKTGKTNWDEQHFAAADEIIHYLQNNKNLWSRNQILDPSRFELASIHKTAEIIFSSLGDDYADQRQLAFTKFRDLMANPVKDIDLTEDGRHDIIERLPNIGITRR